jgi:hypothetical protein
LSDNELGGVDDGKALGIVTALEIKRRARLVTALTAPMVELPFKTDRADRGVTLRRNACGPRKSLLVSHDLPLN